MAEIRVLPPAAKYFKKIKDKYLKARFRETIDKIVVNPFAGTPNSGDLDGIYCMDFH